MDPEKLSRLKQQVAAIDSLKGAKQWGPEFQLWENATKKLVRDLFGDEGITLLQQQDTVSLSYIDDGFNHEQYHKELDNKKKILEGLLANASDYQPEGAGERGSLASDKLKDLHPAIYEKCCGLYEKEEYAEAAEKGFKVVRDRLRVLTGYETGSEAFGKGKLHIKGAAAQNVDKDFNQAVKFLTMAVDNFRNEKSHTSDAKMDDPTRAYEYLRLSSLAMNLLENVEILH